MSRSGIFCAAQSCTNNLGIQLFFFVFKSAVSAQLSAPEFPFISAVPTSIPCPYPYLYPHPAMPTLISTPPLSPFPLPCSGGLLGCCTPSAQHPNAAPKQLHRALSSRGAERTLSIALAPWLNTFHLHSLCFTGFLSSFWLRALAVPQRGVGRHLVAAAYPPSNVCITTARHRPLRKHLSLYVPIFTRICRYISVWRQEVWMLTHTPCCVPAASWPELQPRLKRHKKTAPKIEQKWLYSPEYNSKYFWNCYWYSESPTWGQS